MRADKLVYKTDIKLVFDNDCLASFIWIKRIDILVDLYRDRIFVPQVVVDEFSFMKRYSKYSWVYKDEIEAIDVGLFKVIEIDSEYQAFIEYNKLIKMGKRRTYTEEFKRDAVELSLNSDKSVKEIAEDLGINYGNLNRWRREYRNNRKLKNEKLKLEIAKIYWQHGAAMEAPEYTNSW